MKKNIAKSIKTSANKMAINFGTELQIIDKNGILLKKYISDSEINDIVMTDGVVGIVFLLGCISEVMISVPLLQKVIRLICT